MHTYPTNSPQAAARVLAMALFADGHCSAAELAVLHAPDTPTRLGLSHDTLDEVIQGFVNQLMLDTRCEWTGTGRMDAPTRDLLLSEVTDPALQARLYALAESLVRVDGHMADGERAVLDAMARRWQLTPATEKKAESALALA